MSNSVVISADLLPLVECLLIALMVQVMLGLHLWKSFTASLAVGT